MTKKNRRGVLVVGLFMIVLGLYGWTASPTEAVGPRLYWLEAGQGAINRANLDGSGVENLAAEQGFLVGIALDLTNAKMYWTDDGGEILRADLDGANSESLVTGLNSPFGIALDQPAGKMYWTDNGAGKIQQANLDGTGGQDIITGLTDPKGLALDPTNNQLYWSDGDEGKIQRADLDGSNVTDVVTGLTNPSHVALDVPQNKLYWADFGSGKIQRADLTGLNSNVEDLATGQTEAHGVALDLFNRKLYWSAWGLGKIQKANLDGSSPKDVVTDQSDPTGLALDLTPAPPVGRQMYWVDIDTDKIQRADLDGSNVEDLITSGLSDPRGIVLDTADRRIYWSESGFGRIKRANLDGSGVEFLVSGLSQPNHLALDLLNSKLYWTDEGTGKLQRANLDGSNVEDLITGLSSPVGVALDVINGKVYWANFGAGTIQRANLDGSAVETLVTGLSNPQGVALDLLEGKIYWADSGIGADKIQRADLDGGNVEDLVTGLPFPRGVALDILDGRLYWTDLDEDKIQRANLDGGNVEDLVTSGLSTPSDITLTLGPVLALEKTVTPGPTVQPGERLTYTIALTNYGTQSAAGAVLSDTLSDGLNFVGPVAIEPASLGPGGAPPTLFENLTLTAGLRLTVTFPVTVGANPSSPILTNTAALTSVEIITPVRASAPVNVVTSPALTVSKTANVTTATVGQTITYTYRLTNAGDVDLSNLQAVDDRLGAVSLSQTGLTPDQVATGTLSYLVAENDLPGPLTNTVTVSGTPPFSPAVTAVATESVSLTSNPAITVTKTANAAAAAVGQTITYTYRITNVGNVSLSSVQAVDDRLGAVSLSQTSLTPDQVATGTLSYLITENDLPGPLTNTVTVSGTPPFSPAVTAIATETVSLTSNPALTVSKIANAAAADVGQTITYSYRITNVGDVSLSEVRAVDDRLGAVSLSQTSLTPGQVATGTLTYTLQNDDLPGPLTNTVTVSGASSLGAVVTATASATVAIEQQFLYLPLIFENAGPDLVGSFTLTPPAPEANEPVLITVVITNIGPLAADSFWVDFYINPAETPGVNKPWHEICQTICQGLAWFVVDGLAAGQQVVLTSNEFSADHSIWNDAFPAGTSDLYLYVDSWNPTVPTGGVLESNEMNNLFYMGVDIQGVTTESASPGRPALPPRPARLGAER